MFCYVHDTVEETEEVRFSCKGYCLNSSQVWFLDSRIQVLNLYILAKDFNLYILLGGYYYSKISFLAIHKLCLYEY